MSYRRLAIVAAVLAGACTPPGAPPSSTPSSAPSVIAAIAAPASAPADPAAPYWVEGPVCGEDDCDNIPGRWRTFASVHLYANVEDATPSARLAADEWVNAVEKRSRYTPQRGVVELAGAGLAVGDVVYGPYRHREDDGRHEVSRGGQRVTLETDAETPRIAWDEPAPGSQRRTWVRVTRADGSSGSVRDPDFACMGEHPPSDEKC